MYSACPIKAPFFEIGPKSYLYGDDVLALAAAADAASARYGVEVIFTAPVVELRRVAQCAERLRVFAPHMDPIRPGRGVADTLPESLAAAGAAGVMLGHCERPLSLAALRAAILRADELGLASMACADSIAEAAAVAQLAPNIIVAEPTELIGTGKASEADYVRATTEAVRAVNPDILVLQGAGIKNSEDVRRTILAGADATGCSSGIAALPTREARAAMVDEMLRAVREAWDLRGKQSTAQQYIK